jgi:hypothetical protein
MKRRRIDSHPEPQKVADFRDFRSAAVPMLHLRAPGFAVITVTAQLLPGYQASRRF